ncbi:hypothetical protein PFDG_03381 [Plasmodium falciparum Dd2]|uniref:Uncharacterized protein n=1 Tax=Plasmodium falciparum (isolate Dd2) TaxID=57267 RepID=A0A0L7M2Y7_PLAF4|nr:hypothetical protein PFDG_03381 [Plasmodium falciparum Dd2]
MNQSNLLYDNVIHNNFVNTFRCVNLIQYKPKIHTHMSIYVPLNDEKKFLILFNILDNNKNKRRILIYYNKSDIYSFYLYLNSYIPCIFLSNTFKMNCTKNLVHHFNTTNDYILITNDKTINKIYDLRINLYIHYTFDDDITSYMDILSNHSPFNLKNVNENNQNVQKGDHNNEKDNNEIQSTLIDDNKHITEAEKIYEKYGHTFISAALYYIQKKKLFHTNKKYKNKTQNEHFSNIHFIIEKNISINTKNQLMSFLNELLNFNKTVGDIKFFIQNYIYSKRGYILTIPEHIYNILHKNKNDIENVEKYKHIHMYILYNNYQKDFTFSCVKKGKYKSKKAKRYKICIIYKYI